MNAQGSALVCARSSRQQQSPLGGTFEAAALGYLMSARANTAQQGSRLPQSRQAVSGCAAWSRHVGTPPGCTQASQGAVLSKQGVLISVSEMPQNGGKQSQPRQPGSLGFPSPAILGTGLGALIALRPHPQTTVPTGEMGAGPILLMPSSSRAVREPTIFL